MRSALFALMLACGSAALPAAAKAPPPSATSVPARNLADFDFVVNKIRANYAGWDTKVTPTTKPRLDELTARLRARAATASDAQLGEILSEWIAFFNDRHTTVRPIATAAAPTEVPPTPELPWSESEVRARLAQLSDRDPLEGIWSIAGQYRDGVLRTSNDKRKFAAVVLSSTADNWRPGQVKAEITRASDGSLDMLYRQRDHSEVHAPVELAVHDSVLKTAKWDNWVRELPAPADPDEIDREIPSSKLFLKRLSPQTLWIHIPWFLDDYAKPLKDLLEGHEKEIASTPNLVIDIRGNGGGSDYVFAPLLPLIYTRPIINIGMGLRATRDNIALRHAIAEKLKAEAPEQAAMLEEQNAEMRRNLGKYVGDGEFDYTRFDTVRPFPRHVAVLIDGAGSTAEQFIIAARQSRKVTLMGYTNSAGVLDFANVVGMDTPSGRYHVQWAISRSSRLPADPVDPYGIPPDVRISKSIEDPVLFAASWLERQVDY